MMYLIELNYRNQKIKFDIPLENEDDCISIDDQRIINAITLVHDLGDTVKDTEIGNNPSVTAKDTNDYSKQISDLLMKSIKDGLADKLAQQNKPQVQKRTYYKQ